MILSNRMDLAHGHGSGGELHRGFLLTHSPHILISEVASHMRVNQ